MKMKLMTILLLIATSANSIVVHKGGGSHASRSTWPYERFPRGPYGDKKKMLFIYNVSAVPLEIKGVIDNKGGIYRGYPYGGAIPQGTPGDPIPHRSIHRSTINLASNRYAIPVSFVPLSEYELKSEITNQPHKPLNSRDKQALKKRQDQSPLGTSHMYPYQMGVADKKANSGWGNINVTHKRKTTALNKPGYWIFADDGVYYSKWDSHPQHDVIKHPGGGQSVGRY